MRFARVIAGFGDAVFVNERFALVGPETMSCADDKCWRLPLVAVMVSEYVPGGVAPVVSTVSVDDFAEASVIEIDGGAKLVVVSPEAPLTVKVMFPVKPPTGAAVMV